MHRKTHHLTATTTCPHTGQPCTPGIDLVRNLTRAIALADGAVADDFSLSGTAFFVVGLHPNASRPARQFSSPVLVFNLHAQFERLRADGYM